MNMDLIRNAVAEAAKRFGAEEYELTISSKENTAVEALKKCRVPVIFYHGDTDDFVPCEMSRECYEACPAPKELIITPGAGHGLCYPVDTETYVAQLREFNSRYA